METTIQGLRIQGLYRGYIGIVENTTEKCYLGFRICFSGDDQNRVMRRDIASVFRV